MKASEIIAIAVAETTTRATEAGMVTTEAQKQAVGRAAMHLLMTTQPELWVAYEEEVFETLHAA